MIYYVLELTGVFAFAISGALAALQNRLDLSAAIVLAFLVGNGGGTIRDLLLNTPVFWFQAHYYIYLSAITGAVVFTLAYLIERKRRSRTIRKIRFTARVPLSQLLLLCDAVGLGVFTVDGAAKALSLGTDTTVAVMMGVLTAVGGGVIRDLICNQIPMIFQRQLYATPALLGAIIYVTTVRDWPTAEPAAMFWAITAVIGLRLLGIYRNWGLPVVKHGASES